VNNAGKGFDAETTVAEIACEIANTLCFDEWVNILVKLSARRKLLMECYSVTVKCYETEEDVKTLLSGHTGAVSEISGIVNGTHGRTTGAIMRDTMQMFKYGIEGSSIVKSCIPSIDAAMTHTRRQMHVLSAFPGTGKTSFALSVIAAQIQQDIPAIIFCKESSSEETAGKLLSIYSGIPYIKLLTGMKSITQNEMAMLSNANEKIRQHEANLYIRGGGDYKHSIDGIRVELKRMKEERGVIGSVWVDYLQNMDAPAHLAKKDKTPQVEYNIEALKDLFIEFDCAGTVLSQINREGAKQGKPQMHHLKYASAIEAEAHIISFLYRDKTNDETRSILETEWYSEKTRLFGPFSKILMFHKRIAHYTGKEYSAEDRP
jgi:replicative DNA helicase